jgi:hypothetical protein
MKRKLWRPLAAALCVCAVSLQAAEPAGKTRLFILSGQSNMKHLDPEVSFTPRIKAAFPNDEILVVKVAQSGQPIRRWYRDWVPATGELPKGTIVGDIYATLMKKVDETLQGKPTLDTVTFVWMQGEADTATDDMSKVYEDSLRGLISQLRTDLNRPDTTVVIGRISDYAERPEGSKIVREAEMAVVKADPKSAWIDTDDLNGKRDDLHYTKEGYITLGERFADKAIEIIKKEPSAQPAQATEIKNR